MPEVSSLGAFSISLAVADLAASIEFYAKLGFTPKHEAPGPDDNWTVLSNGTAVIGLFQGMFDANIITFNPGWDQAAQPLADFEDVRSLEAQFVEAGLEPDVRTDPSVTEGPAHLVLTDPDGNQILIDQHR